MPPNTLTSLPYRLKKNIISGHSGVQLKDPLKPFENHKGMNSWSSRGPSIEVTLKSLEHHEGMNLGCSRGPSIEVTLKPFEHHNTKNSRCSREPSIEVPPETLRKSQHYEFKMFKRALNWSPMMPRNFLTVRAAVKSGDVCRKVYGNCGQCFSN